MRYFYFRCRRKCLETFTVAAREILLGNFNTIGNQDGQDADMMSLISCKEPQRRRPKGTQASFQRSWQCYYQVKLGDYVKLVCREAFVNPPGVGTKRVRRVAQHHSEGATPKDKRGTCNNRKCIPEDLRGKGGCTYSVIPILCIPLCRPRKEEEVSFL